MHILFFLQTAFSIWMLIDAIKRGSQYYWLIIVMVPFGEWVYFFMVKIHDPEFQALGQRLFCRPPSLQQLRYNVKTAPSVHNKMALARGLHDQGEHVEAVEILDGILRRDSGYKEALHVLALCHEQLDQRDEAIGVLEQLVRLDVVYADYEPAQKLARLYGIQGRNDERLALLRNLVNKTPRLGHMLALATCLLDMDQRDEAKALLHQALEDFDHAPGYVRRKDRTQAKTARCLWREQFGKAPS